MISRRHTHQAHPQEGLPLAVLSEFRSHTKAQSRQHQEGRRGEVFEGYLESPSSSGAKGRDMPLEAVAADEINDICHSAALEPVQQ